MVVLGTGAAKTRFAENTHEKEFLAKTWNTSPPQEGVSRPLLSKGMVKLPFLQAFKSISPGRGRHAPVGVQENPEAPDNEDTQEDKQQNHKNKCSLLLQRHARLWQRVPEGHQGWRNRLSSIHCLKKTEQRVAPFLFVPSSVCWDHGVGTLERLSYLHFRGSTLLCLHGVHLLPLIKQQTLWGISCCSTIIASFNRASPKSLAPHWIQTSGCQLYRQRGK